MDSSGSSSGSNSFEGSDTLPKKAIPHCHKLYYDDEDEKQKSKVSDIEDDVVPDIGSDSESDSDGYGDGLRGMTKKEYLEYYKAVGISDGFDVPEFPQTFALGIIIPFLRPGVEFTRITDHLNSLTDDANYEFVKVVKANSMPVVGFMYYITFEAKDKDKDDNPVETFEAKVYLGITDTDMDVLICRHKKVTIIDQGIHS
ncbi:uncharacterized protein LOC132303418 isoform X2 [Cornus florida]|uniref:uncharacterized protein LOC132303418 isoform X2 n=1 Tax=Cornus florida TaxID=4283 RepID=UPI00289CCB7D|nr:uncharacterized protein LOC132303418 isoform X2 [Cornus florida]